MMPTWGPCPAAYGPEYVFVRRRDTAPPPGATLLRVPRWAFWLMAMATRLIAFHWSTNTTGLARRDISQLYIQILAALRFRAFNLPPDPAGYTYGIPRPDGTWLLPDTNHGGSRPGTFH
jgi:hypothetical protein